MALNINFNNLWLFNAYKTDATSVSSPLQEFRSIKEKSRQPMNMDIVSISSKIESEMRRMVEETKPASVKENILLKTGEEVLAEKLEEIDAEKIKMTGEEAELLYAAEEGISQVQDHLKTATELIKQLNEDYYSYTDKDILEFQKEIEKLMEKIDTINGELLDQGREAGITLNIDIRMDCEALGLEGMNVLTEKSALKAGEMLDGAVVRAVEIEKAIKAEIERLENLTYEERLAEIEEKIKQMQRDRMNAEQDQRAAEKYAISFDAKISETIAPDSTEAAGEGAPVDSAAGSGE